MLFESADGDAPVLASGVVMGCSSYSAITMKQCVRDGLLMID